jgi:chemotaxis protein methyltransferase CheR
MSPSELVARRLGHVLSDAQSERLEIVVRSQVPAGQTLEAWIAELSQSRLQSEPWSKILESVLVPKTQLFRHPEQLAALRDHLRARATGPQSVWSAACASGEEAFSLAACMGIQVRIVATDIGAHLLERAALGRFPRSDLSTVPQRYQGLFQPYAGGVAASSALLPRVRFAWSDLRDVSTYPSRPGGGWDAILCRNVLFYFKPRQRLEILRCLSRQLSESGLLILGPAEQVSEIEDLETVTLAEGVYAYRKVPFGRTRWGRGRSRSPSGRFAPEAPPRPLPKPRPRPKPQPKPEQKSPAAQAPGPSGSADQLLERAFALRSRDSTRALELVHEAAGLADLDPELHWAVARAYRQLGEPAMAAASLRRTLLLSPKRWEAAFQLAGALFELGRHREAEREYARTRRLMVDVPDPENLVAEADAACRRRIDECRRLQ